MLDIDIKSHFYFGKDKTEVDNKGRKDNKKCVFCDVKMCLDVW